MKRFLLLFIHLGILFTCVHANTNFFNWSDTTQSIEHSD